MENLTKLEMVQNIRKAVKLIETHYGWSLPKVITLARIKLNTNQDKTLANKMTKAEITEWANEISTAFQTEVAK